MGVGPVQFGMMLLLNCALGLVHPPVGTVQFVGCAIGNISIGEATKTAWPYYLAIFIAITLVTYVPAIFDVAAVLDHGTPRALTLPLRQYGTQLFVQTAAGSGCQVDRTLCAPHRALWPPQDGRVESELH
jgi:hypothetical protein